MWDSVYTCPVIRSCLYLISHPERPTASVVFARHVTFVVVVLKAADVGADGGHLCECQQLLLHRQSHPHRQSRCPESQFYFYFFELYCKSNLSEARSLCIEKIFCLSIKGTSLPWNFTHSFWHFEIIWSILIDENMCTYPSDTSVFSVGLVGKEELNLMLVELVKVRVRWVWAKRHWFLFYH